jgi:hypothetical protein
VKFRAGGLEFNATVAEAGESPSAQTGEPLRVLTIQFRAQQIPMHEQALEQAQQRHSGGLFSLGDGDQPELEWRVRDSTSSYVGTEPWGINHHVWRIEQVERLLCTRLVLGPLELAPYEYAEEVGDDGLVRLVARALVEDAHLEAVAMMPDVVPVTRVGISDTPCQMRLAYLWGARPEGLAVIVRCIYARTPQLTLEAATLADDTFGDLITVLSAKRLLDDADLARLRRLRHEARQISDI